MKSLLFALFTLATLSLQARTVTVQNTNSTGPGSLRAIAGSSSFSGDTIRFNPALIAGGSDTIVITSPINISRELVIIGLINGADTLFISGGGTNQIFWIPSNSIVLDSLAFIDANGQNGSWGGAIYFGGTNLIINSCLFRGNTVKNDYYSKGSALTFSGSGNLTITNSEFSGNYNAVDGGALYIYQTADSVNITNSIFSGNSSKDDGGAIWLRSRFLSINDCVFIGNSSDKGGAIFYLEYPFFVTEANILNTSFIENSASYYGGAIYFYETLVYLSNSTISNNTAQDGGGVYAIDNTSINVSHSTITGNKAISGASGGGIYATSASGGGIYAQSLSNINILNSTIYGNSAILEGGGVYTNDTSKISLKSSIVAGNYGLSNINSSRIPKINSQGYNMFSDSISGSIVSDQLGIDSIQLGMGPLQNNGGLTNTMTPGFFAINKGNPLDSTNAQNMPLYGRRDIGAAENCISFFIDTGYLCTGISYVFGGNTLVTPGVYFDTVALNVLGCDSINVFFLFNGQSTTGVDFQVACDSFTWINGVTYTTSNNTAVDTITNFIGCDSILTLNLTIINSTSSIDTQSHCDSYTWMNGITYTASNSSATDTLTNAAGCDSIITLNLTIKVKTYSIDVVVSCDSFTWINGITYYSSIANEKDTLTNALGCDSIITLDLTINYSNTGVDVQVACDSFTWINGVTYTASINSVKYTITNTLGCDSIVSLYLVIRNSSFSSETITACDSYTWRNGMTYTTNNNSATDTIFNSKGCDSIITLNLTINNSTSSTDVKVACGSYTWNGVTYTSSTNTPTQVFTGANGCDSVVTLNLTINNATSSTDVQIACGSYTWNGVTYTSSTNVPTQTFTGANGCDSVATLNLTINNSTSSTDMQTACGSYTWNGVTYTSSTNVPTQTLTGSNGCDSVVTLNLTINQPTTGTDVQVACGSYTWNGTTYTSSTNTPTKTLTGSNGCDSVVTLNLTINQPTSSTDVQTACGSYTWNGTTYTSSTNTPTKTLTGSNGCDSVVTLNLTINNSTSSTDVQTACGSYTWNGVTYTSSTNVPTQTLTGSNGCDSVVTLSLTITNTTSSIDVQNHCDSYTWRNGVTYTSSTNTVKDTLTSASGCDSIITLYLTINTISAGTISATGGVLTVSSLGTNYKWLNCDSNYAPIVEAGNTQTYVPTQNGNYACMVYSADGCSDTTACFNMLSVGVQTIAKTIEWNLFPNPAITNVTVKIAGTNESGNIKIYSTTGQLVYEDKMEKGENEVLIDVSNMASGVYTVIMQSGELISTKRLVIQ